MKVDKLHIRSRFKNLNDIVIDFDENHLVMVIVGRNGTGKSNVVEALVSLFRNLDLGEAPPFSYEIGYQLGEKKDGSWREVQIDADPERGSLAKQYQVTVRGGDKGDADAEPKKVPFSKVSRNKKTSEAPYLPSYLFAYYSGPSDRLERYFRRHRANFYRKLLSEEVDLKGDIRPLFYAKPFHSQFVLLAFFLASKNNREREFLREHLGIVGLDSIHFVMRKPSWSKEKGELFWGAAGVVRQFLDQLLPFALAPVKVTRAEDMSLTGSSITNEFFHLFLPSVDSLREFAQDLSPDELFKMLESTLLSELISEVSVRVAVENGDAPLTFRELSEGEQQLLTVLGLLKFTGGKDALFLLDEPDTHLNPSWAVKYLQFLRDFVPNHKTSHLVMLTHHPLAIAELERGQVQVMKRFAGVVEAGLPLDSPRGMGINLILRSDMFGLQTTLDSDTNNKVMRRNALASKEELSKAEEDELATINKGLQGLGFNLSSDDPDYLEYLRGKYHSADGTA
jgi:predicted ATPase